MSSDKLVNDILNACQYKYKDLSKRDISSALGFFKVNAFLGPKVSSGCVFGRKQCSSPATNLTIDSPDGTISQLL